MRKVLSWILVLMILASIVSVPVYASKMNELEMSDFYQMRFSHINIFQSTFDITNNGKSEVAVYLNARNADKVKVKAYLQKSENGKWKTIKIWSEESEGNSVGLGKDYYVVAGFSYRVKTYGYVYDNSKLVEKTSSTSKTIDY